MFSVFRFSLRKPVVGYLCIDRRLTLHVCFPQMHLILIDSLHIDHLVYFVAEVYRFCKARMDLPFIYINLTSIHSNDDERMLAHSCLSTNALLVEKSHTFTSLRRTGSMNKTATLATFISSFWLFPAN